MERSSTERDPRLAKSLLEPRVVADRGEVVVRARHLPERREQLDAAPEAGERLVAGLARERREARVVVVEARAVWQLLEASAHRVDCVGVALLAVGLHRLVVERPRLAPVERLVRLAGGGADREHGSLPGRLAP